ncbi:MAG: MATE family efflux transporter, partial [Oscillospiraceae bacterium]
MDEMKENQNSDLGRAPVGKLLLSLAVPAITAQLVNMLYNIVDRIYIGHIPVVGATALPGVGVVFPILMIISAFASLVGMGGAPRAAIRMGEGDHEGAERILGNCFTAMLGISAVLTVFFLLFGEPLLLKFGASPETLPYALDYMNTYVLGTVFVQLALGLNAFITTQGFARIGMMTVLFGAIANIVLDPIFIFVLDMGVEGAALASVISQGISAGWALSFLFGKKSRLRIRPQYMRLSAKVLLPVLALGVSPFIMQSTESAVSIALNSSLQRYGGDVAVGAMTIISSSMQVMMMPLMGLSQGAQPIISFNYGAKNNDRVYHTLKLLLISAMS